MLFFTTDKASLPPLEVINPDQNRSQPEALTHMVPRAVNCNSHLGRLQPLHMDSSPVNKVFFSPYSWLHIHEKEINMLEDIHRLMFITAA